MAEISLTSIFVFLKSRLVLTGAAIIAAAITLTTLKSDPRQFFCEHAQDGVWASNGAQCLRESCYASKSCMLRTFPAAYCGDVVIGDPISRVVLHLGEPMASDGDRLQWHWDKVSHGVGVEAQFRDGKLIALTCPAFPRMD